VNNGPDLHQGNLRLLAHEGGSMQAPEQYETKDLARPSFGAVVYT
jgi:hypothetical protein